MINLKLNTIQTKLKAPKNQFNKFGNYKYRSCEDILEALKPLLKETKTALTIQDEIVLVGDRFYIKSTVKLYDCEEPKNSIETSAYAREPLSKKGCDEAQITGATSSYARKYALNGLFCIDDTKDADSTNTHNQEETPAPAKPKKVSNKDLEIYEAMAKIDNMEDLANFYKENYSKVSDKKAFADLKDMRKEAINGNKN